MIKIIREGKDKEEEIYTGVCGICDLELECTKEDLCSFERNELFTKCPNCGAFIKVEKKDEDEEEVEDVEYEHFIFPDSFYHFGGMEKGKKMNDEEIQEAVNIVKRDLLTSTERPDYALWATGDSIVVGLKTPAEIVIFVAKNYYEDSMEF